MIIIIKASIIGAFCILYFLGYLKLQFFKKFARHLYVMYTFEHSIEYTNQL